MDPQVTKAIALAILETVAGRIGVEVEQEGHYLKLEDVTVMVTDEGTTALVSADRKPGAEYYALRVIGGDVAPFKRPMKLVWNNAHNAFINHASPEDLNALATDYIERVLEVDRKHFEDAVDWQDIEPALEDAFRYDAMRKLRIRKNPGDDLREGCDDLDDIFDR